MTRWNEGNENGRLLHPRTVHIRYGHMQNSIGPVDNVVDLMAAVTVCQSHKDMYIS